MKTVSALFIVLFVLTSGWNCKDSGTESNPPNPPAGGGLTANPSSVRLLPNSSANVSIMGATRPISIITAPSSVATAAINDTVLSVQAGPNIGITSVRVGDNSSPQKTVTIDITIATTAIAMITK
jgi:hypothetical protein